VTLSARLQTLPERILKGVFYFDPSDGIYKDHFPGNPVVPGSLIVNAFMEAGKSAGFNGNKLILKGFRFKKFISPGKYAYRIELIQDQMKCRLFETDSNSMETVVTGTIKI